ncbi:acetyl-coenzyme A carboxylase carboxyl transferase subunit alpha [Planctomycetales bacterium]|nr:acetyl-coenzyme A carboxylase carboxyl transferase subunit alpha [Planctomycetales bacterium]GHT00884.1 acetyl-coenzyme A carboxylase carboxyl transferase subunit alpha [Planctomycetales bacterium]GHT04686.1 acetyl-coenzyme A carboxylase carboxyl transferase subunit alpha [Planctomycetales bacterium]GHV24004.1 acetyl-coenzyme A carboxylase carboxyl transferase subunit alpha [Planctomycetales bacterium]
MSEIELLPFEQTIHALRQRIDDLEKGGAPETAQQIAVMRLQADDMEKRLYENLTPWNIVQLARHPQRPQTRDYLELAFDHVEELHGDRAFGDDLAIVTALAQIGEHRVLVVGQHRGRTVEERHRSHAGCPHPEAYRKAWQKMKMAERFGLPIVTLVDTKGAYPGVGAEERGQGIALAENLRDMSNLRVPVVVGIIGEGGSGGALAIAVGNRIVMMQFAYYATISPEGCAAILWRDGDRKQDAAAALKLTSQDLFERGFIDEIVAEPLGGAHRQPQVAAANLRAAVIRHLDELRGYTPDQLADQRYQKFRAFGEFLTNQTLPVGDGETIKN